MKRRRRRTVEYTTYAARFHTLDFISLVEGLPNIERKLDDDFFLETVSTLEAAGAEIRGDVVLFEDQPTTVMFEHEPSSRRLSVSLIELDERTAPTTRAIDVHGFGLVDEIELSFPTAYEPVADAILGVGFRLYRTAYIALQSAYLEAHSRWVSELFSTAYAIINTELVVAGNPGLQNRFWISASNLATVAFRYHFSGENLRAAVDWFLHHQHPLLSPCAAVTLLLTREVSDGIIDPAIEVESSRVQLDPRTLVIPFARLPTLGSETFFWLAERAMFDSTALAALHVTTVEGIAFEINCPVETVGVFQDVVANVEEDLRVIIPERFKTFAEDQRRLRAAVERTQAATSSLRDLGTDVVAKVISNLMSPGP